MKVTYQISEVVTYERTTEVPDNATDAEIEVLLEKDWVENGDPIDNFYAVHSREIDNWEAQ